MHPKCGAAGAAGAGITLHFKVKAGLTEVLGLGDPWEILGVLTILVVSWGLALLRFIRVLGILEYYKGIDGSARKPVLVQDSEYMVEKTYHIAPYLGPI